MKNVNSDWKLIHAETEIPVLHLTKLEPVSVKPEQESPLGYKAMMEIGRQIDELNQKGRDRLEKRWGEWIILFPGTQYKDKDGNIFVPSLRHVTRMVSLGMISRSWIWEWFSCSLFEREEFIAQMGRGMSRFRDCNNLYREGVGILTAR